MSHRVYGIGRASVDHLAVVDRYPDPDTRNDVGGFSIQGSGTVATALATLASLGVETSFAGKVSDDDFGKFVLRSLAGLDVDISRVVTQGGRLSPYSFIIIERESGRRTAFCVDGNVDPLDPGELDLSPLDSAEILLVDGFHGRAQIRAAEEARRRGVKVVMDAGILQEGMGELVALADVLVASERYASEVAPRGEIEESLIELHRMGPSVVVVTMGEEGSIGLEGDKLVRQPSLQVDLVDATGVGDVYLGGFTLGLLDGLSLERCMQVASAAAGLSCRQLGARAGLPTLEQVNAVSWQEVHT